MPATYCLVHLFTFQIIGQVLPLLKNYQKAPQICHRRTQVGLCNINLVDQPSLKKLFFIEIQIVMTTLTN